VRPASLRQSIGVSKWLDVDREAVDGKVEQSSFFSGRMDEYWI